MGKAISGVIVFILILVCNQVKSYEKKDILTSLANKDAVRQMLLAPDDWVPFPPYRDRDAWQKITQIAGGKIIERGEKALTYKWQVVTATDYLAFDREGNRQVMQIPFNANFQALTDLTLAELTEGEGRFLDQIVNGVWFMCEMTSWSISAHVAVGQKPNTSLPSHEEQVIDLYAGNVASLMSWIYYFLKDELDQVSPLVSARLVSNIRERILIPYMERDDYWWQAFDATPQTMVNNWNPWCNFNVLTSFLLVETNTELLAQAVYRTMVSVDKYLDYSQYDGACEEGPSYWGHAAGKLYDYLQILSYGTGNKIPVFQNTMIRNMGEYIANSYIGNGWVVNFADASAKGGGPAGTIFRYGKAVDSQKMQSFAAYLYHRNSADDFLFSEKDFFRTLENLLFLPLIADTKPAVSSDPFVWYPQTEFCYIRHPGGLFFAAKGGFNAESHNHNDVGSFILYYDQQPLFIDVGVGTYTRKTFSSDRYSIWTMQSNFHNLPIINGFAQQAGREFRSSKVGFDEKKSLFTVDIAGAFPPEAGINEWTRNYQVVSDRKFVITDHFSLKQPLERNIIVFMTHQKPILSEKNKIRLFVNGHTASLNYDADAFDARVETIDITDPILHRSWGSLLYRLTFHAKHLENAGKYQFTVDITGQPD